MNYDLELNTAESILQDKFETPVKLQFCDVVYGEPDERMVMLRCTVENAPAGLPETVIVKRWRDRQERFRRECACLDFLGRQEKTHEIFPTLFGWNAEHEVMVVEDLGDRKGQWLGEILFGDDAQRAELALLEFQRSIGLMHADTMGKRDEFQSVLKQYGAKQDAEDRTDRLPNQLRTFARDIGDWGFKAVAGLEQDVEKILSYIEIPGPFLGFVHGDTTLANSYLVGSTVRLFDLESGGWRHCLTDGVFSRMRYLESSLAHQFPITMRRRMMHAYREALATGCSAALNEDLFIPSFMACCACWMAKQCDRMKHYLKQDAQWGRASERARVVTGLENFAQLSAETRWFGALGETAAGFSRALKQKWPEEDCVLPVYPAFL